MNEKQTMLLGAAVSPSIDREQAILSANEEERALIQERAQNNAYHFALQLIYADFQKQITLTDSEREELYEVFKQLKDLVYADSE
jgi:hypothetical protein